MRRQALGRGSTAARLAGARAGRAGAPQRLTGPAVCSSCSVTTGRIGGVSGDLVAPGRQVRAADTGRHLWRPATSDRTSTADRPMSHQEQWPGVLRVVAWPSAPGRRRAVASGIGRHRGRICQGAAARNLRDLTCSCGSTSADLRLQAQRSAHRALRSAPQLRGVAAGAGR